MELSPIIRDRKVESKFQQLCLFEKRRGVFEVVRKLPYEFRYRFEDDAGKTSELLIEDWEIGALFWNALEATADEKSAVEQVRSKFFDELACKDDLHLFLGTTLEWHKRAPNPFVIVGVFYPPFNKQGLLL